MPANTPRGYPYLQPGDPPDLAGATQALATAVDTDVAALAALAGWTTVPSASTINSTAAVNREGKTIATRGTISPTTSWAANSVYVAVLTFSPGYRPSPSGPSIVRIGVGNSPNALARLQFKSDGTVDMLTSATPPTSIDVSCLSSTLAETA